MLQVQEQVPELVATYFCQVSAIALGKAQVQSLSHHMANNAKPMLCRHSAANPTTAVQGAKDRDAPSLAGVQPASHAFPCLAENRVQTLYSIVSTSIFSCPCRIHM